MRKTYLLSAAAAVTMLFASCEKYDQSDEIGDLKKQLAQTNAQLSSGDAANAAAIAANTAAIEAMMARVAIAIDELGKSDAALLEAIGNGSTQLVALQAQFDAAYADALVLVNEALAASIAQDVELAQQIQELRDLIAALELEQGEQGEDGEDGVDGNDGAQGPVGSDGVDGTDGDDGVDGTDGEDGVDGLDSDEANPDGLGEDGTTPTDAGSQTIGGGSIAGYPSADHAALLAAGFTITAPQTTFHFQTSANNGYELAPPTNGVYSWENADTDDETGTLAEAIAAITNY